MNPLKALLIHDQIGETRRRIGESLRLLERDRALLAYWYDRQRQSSITEA